VNSEYVLIDFNSLYTAVAVIYLHSGSGTAAMDIASISVLVACVTLLL